ncbi:hypothetical protein J4467_02540 [Candidatus Woesearchaeota archaeon]|nr:hypothetical protein [Candidatus Woesearchaeota archaeon]
MVNFSKSYVDYKKGLVFPLEFNNKLAEFLGILTGDGYRNYYHSQHKYLIEISGDKNLDESYHTKYIVPLIKKLFNYNPTIQIKKDQETRVIRIISKGIYNYLGEIGFKNGRKEQIGIPEWIQNNDMYMLEFVKGLVDTDFSLVLLNRKQKKYRFYPRVSVGFKSKLLVQNLEKWLRKKGFKFTISYDLIQIDKRGFTTKSNCIHINGRKNLEFWMKEIGFRNKKHLDKYELYKKMSPLGFEPRI